MEMTTLQKIEHLHNHCLPSMIEWEREFVTNCYYEKQKPEVDMTEAELSKLDGVLERQGL